MGALVDAVVGRGRAPALVMAMVLLGRVDPAIVAVLLLATGDVALLDSLIAVVAVVVIGKVLLVVVGFGPVLVARTLRKMVVLLDEADASCSRSRSASLSRRSLPLSSYESSCSPG